MEGHFPAWIKRTLSRNKYKLFWCTVWYIPTTTSLLAGLDKNQSLSLAFGQPALPIYLPEAILNYLKVQSTIKWAMKIFDHARCSLSGKWPMKSTCPTGKSTSPRVSDMVFAKPCLVKLQLCGWRIQMAGGGRNKMNTNTWPLYSSLRI